MDSYGRVGNSQMKSKILVKRGFSEGVRQSVKSLVQSRKELCSVSVGEYLKQDEASSLIEVTFLGLSEAASEAQVQLAAISLDLPDLLKSLHLCSLNENEIIFLKDINKPLEANDGTLKQNHVPGVLCVMRVSPVTFPGLGADFVFNLLSKYATGVRYTLETYSHEKHHLESSGDDDTNQSVSSIEDDFVTAFEHLDEEEPSKPHRAGFSSAMPRSQQDAASQTHPAQCLEASNSKSLGSAGRWKSTANSASLINILRLKELPLKNSVTTSISDPWIQRSLYRSGNPAEKGTVSQKTFFSSSPADSSESACSSPSPVLFLDEEGYQKSLKAKLELPQIPGLKDGVEDSDSEVSEFFDSFDRFDELESADQGARDPVQSDPSQKRLHKQEEASSMPTMNPPKFKFDRPTLPANVRKPTPRKPESPFSSLYDAPDSPRPVKTSGDDGSLFSPIRSSAFSPPGGCVTSECFCQVEGSGDRFNENHGTLHRAYSDYANSVSRDILSSAFHSRPTAAPEPTETFVDRFASEEGKSQTEELEHQSLGEELNWKVKYQSRSVTLKDSIQKFAADLVERSFGSAFKDLRKGVSSCTSALCHLAIKLTSSVFQMAFYELGRRRAVSLKERAVSSLANFLVSDALATALKDLRYVKKQIFTSTVARFAADLAEELVFEGIMEVCQFSHPPPHTGTQCGAFRNDDKAVMSYARDLSDSVIQEAFIELSQVDVTFTTQAAISVSVNNMKYVRAENVFQSTQTSASLPSFRSRMMVPPNPVQESGKEFTVRQALFYTTGIVTSVPVPSAGSTLCQYRTSDNTRRDSPEARFTGLEKKEEQPCLRNIHLASEHTRSNENRHRSPGSPRDLQLMTDSGTSSNSELADGAMNSNHFSGTTVDMVVNEPYEMITSPKVAKTVEDYADFLTRKMTGGKKSSPRCMGEKSSKVCFADHLSKYIVQHSIGETKSLGSNVSKNVVSNTHVPASTSSVQKDVCSKRCMKKHEPEAQQFSVALGEDKLPETKPSKFLTAPGHPTQGLFSAEKDCGQERKESVTHRFSSATPPPFPTGTPQLCSSGELTGDAGGRSLKPFSKLLKRHEQSKTAPATLPSGQESCVSHSQATLPKLLSGEDVLFEEDKQPIREESVVTHGASPPTPLGPPQADPEWNLQKLTKKLKGELAKEFARNPVVLNSSDAERDTIEKEELVLKLTRSLSDEVESSKDEEYPKMVLDEVGRSPKTVQYADDLATHIVSLATEMAASHLDDKTIQTHSTQTSRYDVHNRGRGNTTSVNMPDETVRSLGKYAGDVAREVISEAKTTVTSRHCKQLRLKRMSCPWGGLYGKRAENECLSKQKRDGLSLQGPREVDSSLLSLPQDPCTSGLTSRYPSCESVTDEYADHVIQILRREGGSQELLMDQYASRLAYRSVKSGLQQALKKIKLKCNRRILSRQSSLVSTKNELLEFLTKERDQGVETKRQSKRNEVHNCATQAQEATDDSRRAESAELVHFSDCLAQNIARDVQKSLKMATFCLPKSLTDSCLYEKPKCDQVPEDLIKAAFSKPLLPSSGRHKLYRSTGSLDEYELGDGVFQTIEQYARKVVDDSMEMSLESAVLQGAENRKSTDWSTYAEKLSPLSGTACRYCSVKEHQYCSGKSSQFLSGQEPAVRSKPVSNSRLGIVCQKARLLHLDVPRIHINLEQKTEFAEKVVAAAIEKAERELSNASLTADSRIGQDGVSFAESLTTEIMTSAMTNIGHTVNISSLGKEGLLQSAQSVGNQQMSLSIGDDSTGSWSNLSFEDEHQDESSSFLHLSDSNGISSSWSSLGLEGDMYEENLSFPPSDSDGVDDKDEDPQGLGPGLGHAGKTLLVTNLDTDPCAGDAQLRTVLQWLVASEAEVTQLHFRDLAKKDFIHFSKRLREKEWKVGDVLQAVLKYCEMQDRDSDEERSKPLFCWLLENA
ncbi:A-kinase anchor protein 11 isoform X2 [Tachyglossus aculeatus]|uniref:A-kinase anchor protein 11 isoform X2 n=1 Tax=Tachyglossus aculeatus TaxID=9261 RepID=UPI0018F76CDC|nr:A-kinase anchor protein 11 isoform X2 [Tachyglossus aculeatus]